MNLFKPKYYWVFGYTETDKPALLGPFESSTQAEEEADAFDEPRIFKLPTRNTARATKMVKAKLLSEEGPDQALTPQLHPQPQSQPTSGVAGSVGEVNIFEGDPFTE